MTGAAVSRRLAAYIYFLVDLFTVHLAVEIICGVRRYFFSNPGSIYTLTVFPYLPVAAVAWCNS